jgi:hypothetical protein
VGGFHERADSGGVEPAAVDTGAGFQVRGGFGAEGRHALAEPAGLAVGGDRV